MDTRTGRIYEVEAVKRMDPIDQQYMKPMEYDPTPEQRAIGKVRRNDPCPCGSGKKFKRCCLWRVESAKRARA
jgi:uncharacterized protein YecA (UPF0149 family)